MIEWWKILDLGPWTLGLGPFGPSALVLAPFCPWTLWSLCLGPCSFLPLAPLAPCPHATLPPCHHGTLVVWWYGGMKVGGLVVWWYGGVVERWLEAVQHATRMRGKCVFPIILMACKVPCSSVCPENEGVIAFPHHSHGLQDLYATRMRV